MYSVRYLDIVSRILRARAISRVGGCGPIPGVVTDSAHPLSHVIVDTRRTGHPAMSRARLRERTVMGRIVRQRPTPIERRRRVATMDRPVSVPSPRSPAPAPAAEPARMLSRFAGRAFMLLGADLAAIAASSALTTGQWLSHLIVGVSTMTCLARFDRYRFRFTVSLLDDLPWLVFA